MTGVTHVCALPCITPLTLLVCESCSLGILVFLSVFVIKQACVHITKPCMNDHCRGSMSAPFETWLVCFVSQCGVRVCVWVCMLIFQHGFPCGARCVRRGMHAYVSTLISTPV
jgi:hypothetical protein